MKLKPLLFAVCLLTAPVLGAGYFGGPPEPGKMPTRFVRIEALAVGMQLAGGDLGGITTRVARVTCVGGHFRVGAALWDMVQLSPAAMPEVHVGFNLLTVPRRTWFFYGAAPDLYVEAAGGFSNFLSGYFYGKLLAGCDVDYYGLGASLETGVATWYSVDGRYSLGISLFAGFRLRLLTLGIGF